MVSAAAGVIWKRSQSKQKALEAELARQRMLLRTLVDHLPESVYIKDTDSRFLLANAFVARLMGTDTSDALIGKTDFDFFPAEEAQQYFDDEQAIIHSGTPLLHSEETVVNQETGEQRWFSTSKVPVYNHAREIISKICLPRRGHTASPRCSSNPSNPRFCTIRSSKLSVRRSCNSWKRL